MASLREDFNELQRTIRHCACLIDGGCVFRPHLFPGRKTLLNVPDMGRSSN